MRVLLDQNITPLLCSLLSGHTVQHVKDLGWDKYADTDLLRAAERDDVEVLITADKNMFYQQNHGTRRIALLVLSTSRRAMVRAAYLLIREAVESLEPGGYLQLELPVSEQVYD